MVTAGEIASRKAPENGGGEKALSFNRKKRLGDKEEVEGEWNPDNRGQN